MAMIPSGMLIAPMATTAKAAITFLIALAIASCTPNLIRLEAEHVSHPFAGWPFGPADEESQLTQASALAEWQRDQWYASAGLGYKVLRRNPYDFAGPRLTGSVRVGYIWRVR